MNEPGAPCYKCGVRPDVACRHRPADPEWQALVFEDKRDGRSRPDGGQGLNFKTRSRVAKRYGRYEKG